MIKLTVSKNWKKLDRDFGKWYDSKSHPDWCYQKKWLTTELVKRKFIKEDNLDRMWTIFSDLTENCSNWKVQSKILSLVTLCLESYEDLENYIK